MSHREPPLLRGEGDMGSPTVRGEDVYPKPGGRVSQQWLAACKEEGAMTADMMDRIADLSNLATALRQVVKEDWG